MKNQTTENLKPSHLNLLAKMGEIRNLNEIRETLSKALYSKALYSSDLSLDVFDSMSKIDILISNAKAELKTL